MNCIVVEDEPAARLILENHISNCPGLVCHGTFSNAFEAQEYLDLHEVDLMFLDINLPEMSGISFLRSLLRPPLVIFTTAYPEYAIDGFDLEIVDFLLKPFSFERFCKAVNKAKEKFASQTKNAPSEKITVKSDKRIYQINVSDIFFIESCGDYVTVHLAEKKILVHGTLKSWEEKMKEYSFLRVHRTAVVNLQRIENIDGNIINTSHHKIPLAEQYKMELFNLIMR